MVINGSVIEIVYFVELLKVDYDMMGNLVIDFSNIIVFLFLGYVMIIIMFVIMLFLMVICSLIFGDFIDIYMYVKLYNIIFLFFLVFFYIY